MSRIKRTFRRGQQKVREFVNAVFIDRSGPAQTTVLYSSGRSGSTWLSEILGSVPRTRLIFEPFHPRRGLKELAEYRYQYVDPELPMPVLGDAYDAVLNGKRTTPWTEQLNRPATMVYKRRLVKLVRANLLFPWLASRYPDQKHVLLLRHPAAVILSQLRNGWELSSARIWEQAELRQSSSIRALGSLDWPASGFLSNLVFWAAENRIAIDHALQSNTMVVFYEHVCLSPAEVLDDLSRFLGLSLPAAALD
ncbi:MAG: sulfotransferase, partial [Woeseiaceae bacterium]